MTIKWGDPIECNGVRPDWLRDGTPCAIDQGSGLLDNDWPAEDWSWWDGLRAFYLPADHPAYVALARGFTPWSGGQSAPDDWDGEAVLQRCGYEASPAWVSWVWPWRTDASEDYDIIGYRKRVDASRPSRFVNPPNLTEAEVRALVGGHDAAHRMVEALRERGQLRPETTAERFTRETGHAVTEAVEAALNWKGE